MGTLNWTGCEVMPLPIGGAGLVLVQIDATTPFRAARAFVGTRAATTYNDLGPDLVRLDIDPPLTTGDPVKCSFWAAPKTTGLTVTFWGETAVGVWEDGPVFTGVDLTPAFATAFPWDADWIVQRIADVAETYPPFGANGKPLRVTRSFPRDTHSWPAVNVQVDAMNPAGGMIGDLGSSQNTTALGIAYQRTRLYSLNLSITGWCGTPEERSVLAQWLGGALEMVLDAGTAIGWPDPSISLRESEDFETLKVPTFLVNGTLTVTVQTRVNATIRASHMTTMAPTT